MNKQSEEGFTLIELLVVILIIGILSAIAIPAFLNQRKAANDASLESDLKNIAVAAQTLPADSTRFAKGANGVNATKTIAKLSYFSKNALKYADIPVSAGTWWTITGDSSKYCIVGFHDQGSEYTRAKPLVYDSTAGGLGRTGDACNPADVLGADGQVIATGNLFADPLFANVNLSNQAGTFGRLQSYHNVPISTISATSPVGGKALETSSNDPARAQGVIFLQSDTQKAMPIEKGGEQWTVSAYVKVAAGQIVTIGTRVVDVNAGYGREYGKNYIGTGDWQRISFTSPADPIDIGSYVGMQITTPPSPNGTKIQYAGPMIERSPNLNPFRTD